jgi:hypothetical protein
MKTSAKKTASKVAGRTSPDKAKGSKTVHAKASPLHVARKPLAKKVFNAGAYERARSNHFSLKK